MGESNMIKFINRIYILQSYPRWHEFAPKFQDNYANHSFRVALYGLIISLIEKNHFHNKVDTEKVVTRAVFHDLKVTGAGSIKHRTKKHPLVKEHIETSQKKQGDQIVATLPESMRAIFTDIIVNAEDQTYEGMIVRAADLFDAMMFCRREVLFGSNYFFKSKYEELVQELMNHKLPSVRWMMEQVENETHLNQFLWSILMLDKEARWSGRINFYQDDDSMHTFRCAALAIFNGYYEKLEHKKEIDMLTLISKVLLHDLVEQWTGDVPGPVKKTTIESTEAFEEYEKVTSIEMASLLPESIKYYIEDCMVNAKSDDYVGEMVNIVDKLDALIKTSIEMKVNPFGYKKSYGKQLNQISDKFNNPCIKYFYQNILIDLEYILSEDVF